MKRAILFVIALFVAGCTDAFTAQIASIGDAATIRCFSGGVVIYAGASTGKVITESQSDGWYFEDAETGKLIRVSGDCVIEN